MSEAAEAGAPPPPAPEKTVAPEQRENIRKKAQEAAKVVGKRLIHRKAREIAEKNDSELEGDGHGHERAIKVFVKNKSATETAGKNMKPQALDIPLTDGKPITVHAEINGIKKDVQIARIVGTVNRNGVAMAQYEYAEGAGIISNPTAPFEIPWEEVINGQILSEQEAFAQSLQGDERIMFEYYAANLAGGERAQDLDEQLFGDDKLDATRETIQKAARKTGILTKDDVEAFIDSRMPKVEAGQTPTVEQQAQMTQLEQVRTLLGDETVVSGETLSKIITNNTNIDAATVKEGLSAVEKEAGETFRQLEAIKSKLSKTLSSSEASDLEQRQNQLQGKYDSLMAQRASLQNLHELSGLSETGGIQNVAEEYWRKLEEGDISEDSARGLAEAFRSGNMDGILDQLLADPQKGANESQEEFENRQKKIMELREIRDKAKSFGVLTILALLLVSSSAIKEFKI